MEYSYNLKTQTITISESQRQELGLPKVTQDVYLYIAIKLLDIGTEIDQVYQVAAPTKETVGAAKKQFKQYRNMVKPIHLMSAYRAGARKVRRSLLLSDIDITLEETQALLKKYWGDKLFGDVLPWEKALLQEREDRGGYILNGLGRPFAISDKKLKDVMNFASQSTGHDLLDLWLSFVWREIEKRGLWEKAWPAVEDFHDETVLEADASVANDVSDCLMLGLQQLNDWLKPNIPIKGGTEITDDFTTFKGCDPVQWYNEKIGMLAAKKTASPQKSPCDRTSPRSPKKTKSPTGEPNEQLVAVDG